MKEKKEEKKIAEPPKKYLLEIKVCEIDKEIPNEILKIHLKSKSPFKKKEVDEFINNEKNVKRIEEVVKAEWKKCKIYYFTYDIDIG